MDTFVRLSIVFLLVVTCIVALGVISIAGDPLVVIIMAIVVLVCIFGALEILRD